MAVAPLGYNADCLGPGRAAPAGVRHTLACAAKFEFVFGKLNPNTDVQKMLFDFGFG